jgi:hypothetical protein
VKGPSGCAVRQNSKNDLVLGPVVLELEEGLIASLTLGLLFWRRSNRQAAAMTMIQVIEIRTSVAIIEILARPSMPFKHELAEPIVRSRRVALAGI